MALVLRLRDSDIISIKLEDGRTIKIHVEIHSRYRVVTYVEADKSIRIDRIKTTKDSDDDSRNTRE